VRNGVSSAPDIVKFQRLLSFLNLPAELAFALADWMDADSQVQPGGGAEDGYYLSLPTPYRTANRPLQELGELALVKGFDSQAIARLKPFVSVLPTVGPINVNFAPAEVLASIAENMSLSDARMLVLQRHGNPFKDIADFRQRLPENSIVISDMDISVSSFFFWVTGRASVNNSQVVTQALLQRSQGWPTVAWQNIQ
jgi:general secretion pathway protein K